MERFFEDYATIIARHFPNVTKKFLLELDNQIPPEDLCLTIASDKQLLDDLKRNFLNLYHYELIDCLNLILIR